MKAKLFLIGGLFLHLASFILVGFAIWASIAIPYNGGTFHISFAFWIYSVIAAILAVPLYIADAVVSIFKNFGAFLFIKLPLALAIAPMVVIFGDSGDGTSLLIWYVYFVVLFIVEAISLFREYD